ncbi:tetratricopeptide repeat protein [Thermosulfuriphilus sp.]
MEKDVATEGAPSFHDRWIRLAERYFREIIITVVVLVIGAAAWGLYQHQKAQKEAEASLRLTTAGGQTKEAYQEALAKLIKDHPQTGAALLARIMLADMHREAGKSQQAREQLQEALKRAPEPLKPFLSLGIGYSFEDEEAYHQAALHYQEAVSAKVGIEEVVYLDLARVNEAAGNLESALSAYEKLLARKPFGERLFFVEARLAELLEKTKKEEP